MHGRSRMTIDPRISAMPGRSTSGFYQPGGHCLHQAPKEEGGGGTTKTAALEKSSSRDQHVSAEASIARGLALSSLSTKSASKFVHDKGACYLAWWLVAAPKRQRRCLAASNRSDRSVLLTTVFDVKTHHSLLLDVTKPQETTPGDKKNKKHETIITRGGILTAKYGRYILL